MSIVDVVEPNIGRISQIKINGKIVAYAYKADISQKINVVTEHCFGEGVAAQWPAVAVAGNASGEIKISNLYVGPKYAKLLELGQPVTVVDMPQGTQLGAPKDTYKCFITSWAMSQEQEKLVTGELSLQIIAPPIHETVTPQDQTETEEEETEETEEESEEEEEETNETDQTKEEEEKEEETEEEDTEETDPEETEEEKDTEEETEEEESVEETTRGRNRGKNR